MRSPRAAPHTNRTAPSAASSARPAARLPPLRSRDARRIPRGISGRSFSPNHSSAFIRASSALICVPRVSAASLSNGPACDLLGLDRFEQRAEVAFAEALVALPLDDLEEDRPDHGLGEDLQQLVLAPLLVDALAVDEDAV